MSWFAFSTSTLLVIHDFRRAALDELIEFRHIIAFVLLTILDIAIWCKAYWEEDVLKDGPIVIGDAFAWFFPRRMRET